MWLDAWEWECCGAPFSVGETVDWRRRDVEDRGRLTAVLGTELAASITDAETHHSEEGEDSPLSGAVARIRAVFATRGADDSGFVPGSATFADRDVADAAEHSTEQARSQVFVGYLVGMTPTA